MAIMFIIGIILFIGLISGTLALQYFLSTRENKWLGLLPSVCIFIFSITVVLFFVVVTPVERFESFESNGEIIEQYTYDGDGHVIESKNNHREVFTSSMVQVLWLSMAVLLFIDWPILILLLMHFILRKNRTPVLIN